MQSTPVMTKSMDFAVRIVRLYQHLCDKKHEFVMSKQILRSGTSIGANVHEAVQSPTQKDFTAKMYIALKEASETDYWLELLYRTDYISSNEYNSMKRDCAELNYMLIAIVNKSKETP